MEIKNISEYIKADTIDLNLKAKNKEILDNFFILPLLLV